MPQRILKPLDYGAMLDEMFDVYKKNFLLLSGITGIIYLPGSMLYNYALSILNTRNMASRNSANIDLQGLIVSSIFTFAVIIMYFSLSFIVTAAITWAVSKVYLGYRVTIMQSYKTVARKVVPFALTMMLVSLLVMAGTVLLCIPGIIVVLLTVFVSVVFIIEGKQYSEAIKRSFELVKDEWVKVLVFGLLIYLVKSLISTTLVSPFLYKQLFLRIPITGSMSVLEGFCTGVAQTLVMPIQAIAFVLLYYDIRIRKEGFDIEMLAAGLDDSSPAE